MSYWRIDEQATGQILRSTAACAQQYAASRGDASTAAGSLSDALSNSGIVAAAVAGWMAAASRVWSRSRSGSGLR